MFVEGFLSLTRVEERLMRCYAEIPQSSRFLEILKLSGCSQGWHKLGNPAEACKITSPFQNTSVFIHLADILGNQANVEKPPEFYEAKKGTY